MLEAETVALVLVADEDRIGAYCAGVWVAKDAFLTAGHCVATLGEPEAYGVLAELGLDMPPWNPVGQRVMFSQQGELSRDSTSYYRTAKVAAFDKALDLALVRTDDANLQHATARVSQGEIDDGDRVEIVGHPSGHWWSYAEGYVSATRPTELNADRVPMPTLQLNIAISHGNSGGGAFDRNGELIGVCSYGEGNTNGMGFFVHRDAIRKFLRGAGAA